MIARLRKPLYRGCFALSYAYGLRIGEAVTLPVTAVDSKQMVLRVIGKGDKQPALPLEALGQLTELIEQPLDGPDNPFCPDCGSPRTSLLAQWPNFGEP